MERVKRARVEAGGKPLLPEEPKGRQTGSMQCDRRKLTYFLRVVNSNNHEMDFLRPVTDVRRWMKDIVSQGSVYLG